MSSGGAEIRAFLICDVRGYTRFTVENGDEAAAQLAATFAGLVGGAVAQFGGDVLELRGDEALVVFTSARQAVRAAVELQRRCAAHNGSDLSRPLRVGAGIDAGEAVSVLGGYRGQALNLAARLCSLAGPEEVLASDSLIHLAGRLDGIRYQPRGSVQLKGFAEPVDVVAVEGVTEAAPASAASAAAEAERLPIGAYLGSLPAGPLVGRDREWARLLTVLDGVGEGSGRTALLAGEPGAGKTRLAQESALALRDRGFLIAAGSCLETRQAVPYFPFLDVLPRLAAAHSRLGLGNTGAWPYLDRLLSGGGTGLDVEQAEEERVRRDVGAFIAALSRVAPVAILLDDLHWADASTLELVHHLARQLRVERVFILATYRDVEVRHDQALELVIRALRRDELSEVIPVRRLDPAGTAALVAASFGSESVSTEFSELIHGQTEGNPFFVQQVLRALVERGDVYREGDGWGRRELDTIEIPESIRSAVGERVARLPEASRTLLPAAAILGQRFEFEDLQAVSGLGENDLEAALDAAVTSGLVRSGPDDTYVFEHALAQQTLLSELPARRRRKLHGLAGAAIAPRAERDPGRAAEVAFHLLEADEPLEAARWSLVAGRHAEQLVALAEAEDQFAKAAALAEEAGDARLHGEALTRLGTVLGRRGSSEAAVATLERAQAALGAAGDTDAQAFALAEMAKNLMVSRRGGEIGERLEPFLAGAGSKLSQAARAALLTSLARGAQSVGQTERILAFAAEAVAAAEAAANTTLRIEAMTRLAFAVQFSEGAEPSAAIMREAIELIDETVSLDVRAVLHNNYAWACFTLGDFTENAVHRRIGAELSDRYANPASRAFGHAMVAQAEYYLGNLREALAIGRLAVSLLADAGPSWHGHYATGQLGATLVALDELEEGERLLRESLAGAQTGHDPQLTSWMTMVLAFLLADTGRAEEAAELCRQQIDPANSWAARGLSGLAYCKLCLGSIDEARRHAQAAVDRFRAIQNLAELAEPLVILGMAEAAAGAAPEARAALEEAIELAAGMPHPQVGAWARLELGRLLDSAGDQAGSEACFEEASELIDRHGLAHLKRRAPERMRLAFDTLCAGQPEATGPNA